MMARSESDRLSCLAKGLDNLMLERLHKGKMTCSDDTWAPNSLVGKRCVVAEFEKTISQLQAEKEKSASESQQGFEDVVKERDQALEDLQSVETAFSDLHQRYERVKGVVEGLKKNEEVLKKCVQDYQGKLKTAEEKAVSVRQQAEDKLDQASQEIEKVRKTTTAEVARLEAALKKSELKIQGLERGLEQKVQENNELTAICDELIAKVGGD